MTNTTITTNEEVKAQRRRDRKIFIRKVKVFARSKTGLKKIRKIAPEIADMIEAHSEYLDIPQYFNDPRVAGNYLIRIYDKDWYTGESGNALLRCAEHLYNYCTGAEAFGHEYEPSIPASFKVIAWGVTDPNIREALESNIINLKHPVIQWTDPDALEYGIDKPLKDGEDRGSIRPDICVLPYLRIERFKATEKEYKIKI